MVDLRMDETVVRTATSATAEIDGQLVALDIMQGVCYGLNHVATRIWALIEEPRDVQSIVDILAEEYDVDIETCREETVILLRDLVDAGLATKNSLAAV